MSRSPLAGLWRLATAWLLIGSSAAQAAPPAADVLANDAGPDVVAAEPRQDWRHPFREEVSTETYNALAEVRGLIDSESWEEAARVIAAWRSGQLPGVAPASDDPRWLISARAALHEFPRRPELRSILNEQYSEMAALRVRRAIADRRPEQLRWLAEQFAGTSAAAEAWGWLGDVSLAAGRFAQAEREYCRGLAAASGASREDLAARCRLAAAMQGREVGSPPTSAVELAGQNLPPDSFEKLVAEMIDRHRGEAGAGVPVDSESSDESLGLPGPGGWSLRRHVLPGPRAASEPGGKLAPRSTNGPPPRWPSQATAIVADECLLINTGTRFIAWQLASDELEWQAALERPSGDPRWKAAPMTPLLARQRIFTRLLGSLGPSLVALDRPSREMLWSIPSNESSMIVSDPLDVGGRMVVLVMRRDESDQSVLQLAAFDGGTGQLDAVHELATVRDVWWNRAYCRATVDEDRILVALGGVVLCVSMEGQLHWVRKQDVVSTVDEEERPGQPTRQLPGQLNGQCGDSLLLVDGHVIIAQPGVREVECLDTRTGRLVWQRVLPDAFRLPGTSGERIMVQCETQLLALDRRSGETLWQHTLADPWAAAVCDVSKVIIADSPWRDEEQRSRQPRLTWLRAEDGKVVGSRELPDLASPAPRLGPLWSRSGRLWMLFRRGPVAMESELIELSIAE